jgi:hypothetical protein
MWFWNILYTWAILGMEPKCKHKINLFHI